MRYGVKLGRAAACYSLIFRNETHVLPPFCQCLEGTSLGLKTIARLQRLRAPSLARIVPQAAKNCVGVSGSAFQGSERRMAQAASVP